MVKTILVPTDFSANAESALNYAIGLAKERNFALRIVHIYQALTSKFGDDHFNQEIIAHAEAEAMQAMEKLRLQVQNAHSDLDFHTECLPGDSPSAVLTAMAGKAENELIVMGTKGAGGLKNRILGSNTYQTITTVPLPVLAIPEAYTHFKMARAGLLTNFKPREIELLRNFNELFGPDVQITLLHVRGQLSPRTGKTELSDTKIASWKSKLEKETGYTNIDWKVDYTTDRLDDSETIPDCIHHMAEESELQALLVSYSAKPFFRRIFSKSLVKRIAHEIHRPVFFFKESLDNQK